METMRLGIEWLSMGIAMSVNAPKRRGEDERWHCAAEICSGIVVIRKASLSTSMVLIRANQSGEASEKQHWAKSRHSKAQLWQSMAVHSNSKAKMANVMAERSGAERRQSKDLESTGKAMNCVVAAKK